MCLVLLFLQDVRDQIWEISSSALADGVWILTQDQASTMQCQEVSDECLIINMEWKRGK